MKLIDMVDFVFSKNAGPFLITFDVLFKDEASYRMALRSGVFEREKLAPLFNVSPDRIVSIYPYDAAWVIKFTMSRQVSSGTFGDNSVFGSQQWAPLIDLEIPD